VGDVADLLDEGPRAADPGPLVPPGHDLPGQVGERRPDHVPPDVDAHHPAGHRVELVQTGRRALRTGGPPGLAKQPGLKERGHGLGHGGLRQAGVAGDL
jgi:hypothetical protein